MVGVPDSIQETLELATDGLDELLAVMTRYVQLRQGVRESNGRVPVKAVDDLLETWYDTELPGVDADRGEADREVPSREDLAEIRERSPLFELSVDTGRGETMMRLTETGEQTSEPETGAVQAAGGDPHDNALARIETELTREGYLVAPVRQDGSARPDAWAVHPDVDVPLAIEVETTTYSKPSKVLTNLRRAHLSGAVPVFVVPTGEGEDETAIARRVSNILHDPVKGRDVDGVYFYIDTDYVTFNGGAEADNGLTAVRPVAEDTESRSNRTRWRRESGDFALVDEAGTEHARVTDVDTAPKEQYPATYSIDQETGTYTVTVPGELPRSYDSEGTFREEWVPIKRPFVPDVDLPDPEFARESYEILLLREEIDEVDETSEGLAVYRDGQLQSLEYLTSALKSGKRRPPRGVTDESASDGKAQQFESEDSGPQPAADIEEQPDSRGGPDAGVIAFAASRLVEDEGNVIPFRDVYDAYESFIQQHEFEPKPDNHFTRVLKDELPLESTRKWLDGKARQCYVGVVLVDEMDSRVGEVAVDTPEPARTDGGETTDAD